MIRDESPSATTTLFKAFGSLVRFWVAEESVEMVFKPEPPTRKSEALVKRPD